MNKKIFISSLLLVFFAALGAGVVLGRSLDFEGYSVPGDYSWFSNIPAKYQNLFQEVYSLIKSEYVVPAIDDNDLYYGALSGMVDSLEDRYSVFLKPDLAKIFEEDMQGSFEGVGMEIGIKDKQLTVIAPLSGTPAEKAGIRAGDEIYAIDGEPTIDMPIDIAVSLIRGEKGTPVVLTIWRKGWNSPQDIEIIRDTIEIPAVTWERKQENIGYIRIIHFSQDTIEEFKKAVQEITSQPLDGLILDLRNNPGGYLNVAVDIAGWWVEEGKEEVVVISRNNVHQETVYKTKGQGVFDKTKTVVLINNGSASGAEILAGALQDWGKAVLVGETTFGKGSVQTFNRLSDGSALKLTVAYWYTPKKRSIEKMGIAPDKQVDFSSQDYKKGVDPQLEEAIKILKQEQK
ncbi:S41 family peptidase [bacterium]|nr:S41 family peptidase [bacterium]